MTRRDWKRLRPTSSIEAMRLCKEYAQERSNLGVERIADRMGVTHDSLYKWLATGRMPAIVVPAYELACGCNFLSVWFASTAGKAVIDMPTGRSGCKADALALHAQFAQSMQLLAAFYEGGAERDTTLAALTSHLEQVAWHRANVAQYAEPELDFTS